MKSNIESNIENINNISKLIYQIMMYAYLNNEDNALNYRRSIQQIFSQLFVTFPLLIQSIYIALMERM